MLLERLEPPYSSPRELVWKGKAIMEKSLELPVAMRALEEETAVLKSDGAWFHIRRGRSSGNAGHKL